MKKNTMTKKALNELFDVVFFERRGINGGIEGHWNYFYGCVKKAWGENALNNEVFKAWEKALEEA